MKARILGFVSFVILFLIAGLSGSYYNDGVLLGFRWEWAGWFLAGLLAASTLLYFAIFYRDVSKTDWAVRAICCEDQDEISKCDIPIGLCFGFAVTTLTYVGGLLLLICGGIMVAFLGLLVFFFALAGWLLGWAFGLRGAKPWNIKEVKIAFNAKTIRGGLFEYEWREKFMDAFSRWRSSRDDHPSFFKEHFCRKKQLI